MDYVTRTLDINAHEPTEPWLKEALEHLHIMNTREQQNSTYTKLTTWHFDCCSALHLEVTYHVHACTLEACNLDPFHRTYQNVRNLMLETKSFAITTISRNVAIVVRNM